MNALPRTEHPGLDRLVQGSSEHRTFVLARLAEEKAAASRDADTAVWRRVIRMYERSETEDPTYGEAYFRHGLVHERLRDWPGAAESYRRLVELEPGHEQGHYRRGYALQRDRRKPESRQSYERALALNPDKPAFLAEMLRMESRDFIFRSATASFLTAHLEEIRSRAAQSRTRILPQLDRPVFAYWAQGAAAAPPLVRACLQRAAAVVGPDRLHLLSADNWTYYTDLPPKLAQLQSTDPTFFSDVLRLSLLSRYGGTWMDATCYLRPNALTSIDQLSAADLFAFRYDGPRISSWFLTAKPASYLVSMLEATMACYWEQHDEKAGYFMFHDAFESLYWADERARENWDRSPVRSARRPHVLQTRMHEDGDAQNLQEILQQEFVHKLTYKYPVSKIRPTSLLSALIRSAPGSGR